MGQIAKLGISMVFMVKKNYHNNFNCSTVIQRVEQKK